MSRERRRDGGGGGRGGAEQEGGPEALRDGVPVGGRHGGGDGDGAPCRAAGVVKNLYVSATPTCASA